MGLGRFPQGSGLGAAKWLLLHGAKLIVTDLKPETDLSESVETLRRVFRAAQAAGQNVHEPVFVLGAHRPEDFVFADLIMRNPGVPVESPLLESARQKGIPIETDVSLFVQLYPHPVIGVTGTRGKSTTTALIGDMLKRQDAETVVAGNIQHSPLEDLDHLLTLGRPVPVVLELSSWLVESMDHLSHAPEISVFTNLSPDHLNRYPSMEAYGQAKSGIFTRQTEKQIAIMNVNLGWLSPRVKSRKYFFAIDQVEPGAFVKKGIVTIADQGQNQQVCSVSEIRLPGQHNIENALAAVLAAHFAGVSLDHIVESLRTFGGLPYRQQIIVTKDGVTYINDTCATSPDGTVAALQTFAQPAPRFAFWRKKKIILISGGASKELPFASMGQAIRRACKHVVLLEGNATDAIAQAIGSAMPQTRVNSMSAAISAAESLAQPGDIILLSPGTASFGLFKNEFDRGEQFNQAVANLDELSTSDG